MSLWWLQPGWTQTKCSCGATIWPEGDPAAGENALVLCDSHHKWTAQTVAAAIGYEREACAQRLDDEGGALIDGQNPVMANVCYRMAATLRSRR